MISAFIPTYNEEKNIRNCIESIQKYSEISEIIVVDDNSNDNTVQIAESAGATVIVKDTTLPKMKSESMNVAAQHASNDIMFVTDADCVIDDISEAIDIAQMGHDMVGMPINIIEHDRTISHLESHEYDVALSRIRPWFSRNINSMYGVSGAGFMIRTQLVIDNPIPADVRGEDLYYSCIAHQNGWTITCAESSSVLTYAIPDTKALLVQRARWTSGYLDIVRRTRYFVPVVDSVPITYRVVAIIAAILMGSMGRMDLTLLVLAIYFGYELIRAGNVKLALQMMLYRQINFLALFYIPFTGGWKVNR